MFEVHQTQHAEATRIIVPRPPVGAKCEVFEKKGLYVLEEGPGNYLQTVCAHAGSGHVEIFDGRVEGTRIIGRKMFRASPMAMGVWHLNGGFQHGLVIDAGGGQQSLGAQFSAVWYTQSKSLEEVYPVKKTYDLNQWKGTRLLTARSAILYSFVIATPGSGRFTVFNGQGKKLFTMPSSFTGSFLLENVFAADGIVLELDFTVAPAITFTWKEQEVPDELEPIQTESKHGRPDTDTRDASPAANDDRAANGRDPATALATGARRDEGSHQGSSGDAAGSAGPAAPVGGEGRRDEGGDHRPEPAGPPPAPRGKRRR